MKNFLIILGFPIWFPILIAIFSVLASLFLVLLVLVVTMFAVFVALLASGLFAGIIAGVIFAIMGHGITGLALIGCGLASIGVSIFFFYLGKVLAILSKNIVLGLKEYFLKGRA